jgi:hypothetical protein
MTRRWPTILLNGHVVVWAAFTAIGVVAGSVLVWNWPQPPQSPAMSNAEANSPATAEAKPAATAEAKPAVTVEAKPAATVEAKPAATVEAKPAATVEAKPAATAEAKPAVNAKSPASADTKPVTNADAKADAKAKQHGPSLKTLSELAEAKNQMDKAKKYIIEVCGDLDLKIQSYEDGPLSHLIKEIETICAEAKRAEGEK